MNGDSAMKPGEFRASTYSGAPTVALNDAARARLRAVAAEAGRGVYGDLASRDAAARDAARAVADDAHDRAVTAEHMIIAVKREWSTLPEARDLGRGAEARAMLERLVTHCIDAFYLRR